MMRMIRRVMMRRIPAVRWIRDTVNLVDGGRVVGGYVVRYDVLFGWRR